VVEEEYTSNLLPKVQELSLQAGKARSFVFTLLYSGFDAGKLPFVGAIPSGTAVATFHCGTTGQALNP
jgi:hypothetical protein